MTAWEEVADGVFRRRYQPHDVSVCVVRGIGGLLGVAACFSADQDGTVQLPFDPRTGVIRPEVWQRWLDWDPVRMIPKYAGALRSLRAVWIDAGVRDEWFLDIGAEAVNAALRAAGVPAEKIRFELFEASHMAIDYRYPMSLAWLCQRIS